MGDGKNTVASLSFMSILTFSSLKHQAKIPVEVDHADFHSAILIYIMFHG